jgi:hypothetical protein
MLLLLLVLLRVRAWGVGDAESGDITTIHGMVDGQWAAGKLRERGVLKM